MRSGRLRVTLRFARPTGLRRTTEAAALAALLFAPASAALAPARAETVRQAGPVFENGQARIVPAFQDSSTWIREHLWVETEFDSDGDGRLDRVHVDVTRPGQTETEGLRVPVVYETSPYYSGTGGIDFDHFWTLEHELGAEPPSRTPMPPITHRPEQPVISRSHVAVWVPRGFAVVHSQSPGTGQSQGCPTVGGANESLAPKAVIDWLNGRARGYAAPVGGEEIRAEWSTGRVGMTGTSYNGTLPLATATTGVEGLEAIIPIAPNTSYYHYYRSNGLVRSPGGYPGEDIDVLYDFVNSGPEESRAYCNRTVRDELMRSSLDRRTGDYNAFWEGRDLLAHIDGVRAPTLMAHGFNDWNVMPEHSYRVVRALKERGVPVQVYYHQQGHGGPPPLEMMNRWFTRYLYEVDNGVEDDPAAWIVREGDDRLSPTPYPDYPHPESESVELHPGPSATGERGDRIGALSLDPPDQAGVESLTDDVSFTGAQLASASAMGHRLLYQSPELVRDLHLSGLVRVRVRLASDRPAANLSVWLVSLPWTEGGSVNDNLITRGWADPQNAESIRESAPLVPGEFVEIEFDLQPDDQVIPAGQRIGLMIFSSDREFTVHPPPGTRLTVDPAGTSVTIPVVGGRAAYERALAPAS